MVNKKHYTPLSIQLVQTALDVITQSTSTSVDVDPFVDDIYFTEG